MTRSRWVAVALTLLVVLGAGVALGTAGPDTPLGRARGALGDAASALTVEAEPDPPQRDPAVVEASREASADTEGALGQAEQALAAGDPAVALTAYEQAVGRIVDVQLEEGRSELTEWAEAVRGRLLETYEPAPG